jgi:hypothetical protein
MIPRWVQRFFTPCPRPVRAMGYLRESLAIQSCYERCCYSWSPHLKRSRAVILEALGRCTQRRRAVIFGSGMLYDVPIDELTSAFREVVLVDIVHPLGTRWRFRKQPKIRLVAADVTETVEEAFRVAHNSEESLPRSQPTLFCDDSEIDLVASVNLLPQLPYLPVEYLVRAGVHSAEAIDEFGRGLVRGHIDYLCRLPGTVALIADVEEIRLDPQGRELDRISTVHGVELPWSGENWFWRLLPAGEAGVRPNLQRRVIGIADVKRAAQQG